MTFKTGSKVAAICSPLVGTFLLAFYLSRFSTPFPVSDGSISTLLVLSAFGFLLLFISFSGSILYVESFRVFVRLDPLKEMMPRLRPEPLDDPDLINQKVFFGALYQYLTLYFPFISVLILLCVSQFRAQGYSLHPNLLRDVGLLTSLYHSINVMTIRALSYLGVEEFRLALSLLYGVVIGLPIAMVMFIKLPLNNESSSIIHWIKNEVKFACFSLIGSFGSFFWLAISYSSVYFLLPERTSSPFQFTGLLIFLIFFHFLANIGRVSSWKSLSVMAFALLIFLGLYVGPSFLGAITLRMFGIGGGIPKTIIVKKGGNGSGPVTLETIQGCLIIMTGSQFTFYPTSVMGDCDLRSDLWSKAVAHPGSVSVKTYLRSDVWQVSGF